MLELGLVELRVPPTGGQQLLVSAALDDAPAVDDEELIGVQHRAEPVRDHQTSPSVQYPVQCFTDGRLGLGVQVRRRLVQDDDRRRLQQKPGDRKTLLLPAGQPVPAVADHGLEAVGESRHEIPDLCVDQGADQLVVGRRRAGVPEVRPE